MSVEEINNKIQAERNRHQQKINNLKMQICKENEHYQRTIENLQKQKEQARSQNKQGYFVNQYKLSENIFKSVNQVLDKFM